MKLNAALILSAAALGLAACGGSDEPAAADAPAVEAAGTGAEAPATADAPAATPAAFDLSQVPVSTAALGAFPYIAVPAGYGVRDDTTMDLAAFPIWTGAAFQIVEGKVYMATSSTPDEKTYSRLEFQRAVENAVKALGGVQVANSDAPNPVIEELPRDLRNDMRLGLGSIYGNPITSYVIRRADKTIWVQVVSDSNHASWTVVDGPPPPPPAA